MIKIKIKNKNKNKILKSIQNNFPKIIRIINNIDKLKRKNNIKMKRFRNSVMK